MKLAHPDWEQPIEFIENTNNVLIIENPALLTRYVWMLKRQIEGETGKFVLSDGNKILNIAKTLNLELDWFNLDINQRKIINHLYAKIKALSINEDYYLSTQEVLSRIAAHLMALADNLEYPITFDTEIDFQAIIKATNVKLDSDAETLLEKVTEYLLAVRDFCGMQCSVLVGLNDWINSEELEEFYKFINYNKLNVLLIESHQKDHLDKVLNTEKLRIIDRDWCEI